MAWSRENWIKGKTALAARLEAGECGGAYAESIIILSSAVSAVAAEIWPGDRIDRKRFVELLYDYCDPGLRPARISIPLLIGHLRDTGRSWDEGTLRAQYMNFLPSQILTSDDVDQDESAILAACPCLARKDIREFSYANVLYTEVRSAFVHEYRPSAKADPWPLAESADDQVSYGNWHGEADRHIHFPVKWLCRVAESVAATADANATSFPVAQPGAWWLDAP